MHGAAEMVAEHLHLDVPGPFDEFFHQHAVVAECRPGLAPGACQRRLEVVRAIDLAHALAAAARPRLHQHGVADLQRLGGKRRGILRLAVIAGDNRHAGLLHQALGRVLQPHGADGGRRGADEDQPGRRHLVDETGILRQEPVAGMDRLCPGRSRRRDDPVAAQIAVGGRRGADMDRLVGHLHMHGAPIGVGVDGDGRDAEAPGRADDPAGNLAAIGDQDLVEHSFRAGLTS
ncbi:MAG: choline dehydrogenase [Rhizobiaceae bacterium]|nr:choline dehydrogenase [Rhizobiaceae bacterium]